VKAACKHKSMRMRKQRLIVGMLLVAVTPLAYSILKDFYLDYRWLKIIEELTEQDEAGPQQRS
jgi:hypothetical protein